MFMGMKTKYLSTLITLPKSNAVKKRQRTFPLEFRRSCAIPNFTVILCHAPKVLHVNKVKYIFIVSYTFIKILRIKDKINKWI